MILAQHQALRSHLRAVVRQMSGLPDADQPAVVLEVPPTRAIGDLATPLAFDLARRVRKAPKAIADQIRAEIGDLASIGVVRTEAVRGYLNFFLDRRPGPRRPSASHSR